MPLMTLHASRIAPALSLRPIPKPLIEGSGVLEIELGKMSGLDSVNRIRRAWTGRTGSCECDEHLVGKLSLSAPLYDRMPCMELDV